ncbi:MAG: hypothetical protein RL092_1947 [Bacteroidota bacterium]|jgi:uncharacterized protein YlbG (UPF0298 family)
MVKLDLVIVSRLALTLCVTGFMACNKPQSPDCFTQAGEASQELRVLSAFNEIELHHEIHYSLVDTTFCGVLIEGPQNLIDKISATVENNKLKITNENTCNFVRSFDQLFHVTIYFTNIYQVDNFSSFLIDCPSPIHTPNLHWSNKHANGNVFLNFITDTISIDSPTGACDTYLSGLTAVAELYNDSYGHINSENLSCNYVYINNSSLQTITSKASQYAFVKIESKGNVILKNQPAQVDFDQQGTGQLIIE